MQLKGADRKHKQDRERFMKRPASEMGKYQPSYDCTILNEMPVELVYSPQLPPTSAGPSKLPTSSSTGSIRLPAVSPPPPPPPPPVVPSASASDMEYKQQWSQPSSSPTDSMNEDEVRTGTRRREDGTPEGRRERQRALAVCGSVGYGSSGSCFGLLWCLCVH